MYPVKISAFHNEAFHTILQTDKKTTLTLIPPASFGCLISLAVRTLCYALLCSLFATQDFGAGVMRSPFFLLSIMVECRNELSLI